MGNHLAFDRRQDPGTAWTMPDGTPWYKPFMVILRCIGVYYFVFMRFSHYIQIYTVHTGLSTKSSSPETCWFDIRLAFFVAAGVSPPFPDKSRLQQFKQFCTGEFLLLSDDGSKISCQSTHQTRTNFCCCFPILNKPEKGVNVPRHT